MNRTTLRSRISPDGVLRLDVPLGTADADRDVQVTIEPVDSECQSQADWERFIRATAGAWQGDFGRPPQGELEARDRLP